MLPGDNEMIADTLQFLSRFLSHCALPRESPSGCRQTDNDQPGSHRGDYLEHQRTMMICLKNNRQREHGASGEEADRNRLTDGLAEVHSPEERAQ